MSERSYEAPLEAEAEDGVEGHGLGVPFSGEHGERDGGDHAFLGEQGERTGDGRANDSVEATKEEPLF